MEDDLRQILPIAARAIFYSIPESTIPGVMKELKDFVNDRGAVQYVFYDYNENKDLERLLLRYWTSRLSGDLFRVEVTLAAVLLSLAASIVANALYDLAKKGISNLKVSIRDPEFLSKFAGNKERDVENSISLYKLLMFRNYLYATPGADDRAEFSKIVEFLKGGGSLKAYVDGLSEVRAGQLGGIENFDVVARGLLLPEPAPKVPENSKWDAAFEGLPLSPHSCFGEIVNCHTPKFVGVDEVKRLVSVPSQFPKQWQAGLIYGVAPKILLLEDSFFTEVFLQLSVEELGYIVGFVTSRGGMTSHTAVTSRGMGKPAICVPTIFHSVDGNRFAAIANGTLLLNRAFPRFAKTQIENLLLYQRSEYAYG